ncbi:hypothetical protein H4696_002853 [Amycolatopsis lexingtonensis]|uniref:DUF4232 domain-containing protein n=1 Tax=Amycolatopsis lexingtonensis TaxID=218822 RepID=A0ABR9HXU8_9PSEU|nr:DUF4232 domain-containing protein [Amycolatopsis lexingtonensis]MBE1495753.1 hypothetical protein [Amycolatopsis lexingtonensis]
MSASGTCRTAAAVGILLATAAACGHNANTAAPTSTPNLTTAPPASTTTASPTQPSVTPPPGTRSTPRTSAPPATPSITRCTTAALRLSLGQGDGAAGHLYVPVTFTNTGRTCTITGYPGVSYFAGADHHQVGAAAVRDPSATPTLLLHRGQSAVAWVDQVNIDAYDPAVCGPTPVTGLRVYPPGSTTPVLLPEPGARACTKQLPGGQRTLAVQAVRRDTGAP